MVEESRQIIVNEVKAIVYNKRWVVEQRANTVIGSRAGEIKNGWLVSGNIGSDIGPVICVCEC